MSDAIEYCETCPNNVACHLERRCLKHERCEDNLERALDMLKTAEAERDACCCPMSGVTLREAVERNAVVERKLEEARANLKELAGMADDLADYHRTWEPTDERKLRNCLRRFDDFRASNAELFEK